MSFSATSVISVQHSDGSSSQTKSHTTDGKTVISESIAAATTNRAIALVLDISECKVITMRAIGGALTVKTNNSSTPDDTIALADGQLKAFVADTSLDQFLTEDVDGIFVTNAGAAAVTLEIVSFFNIP